MWEVFKIKFCTKKEISQAIDTIEQRIGAIILHIRYKIKTFPKSNRRMIFMVNSKLILYINVYNLIGEKKIFLPPGVS